APGRGGWAKEGVAAGGKEAVAAGGERAAVAGEEQAAVATGVEVVRTAGLPGRAGETHSPRSRSRRKHRPAPPSPPSPLPQPRDTAPLNTPQPASQPADPAPQHDVAAPLRFRRPCRRGAAQRPKGALRRRNPQNGKVFIKAEWAFSQHWRSWPL
ncbi:hypothetical protein KQ313_00040, partial [Synechococcus sp. CS-1325]|nr:hypothetical protein [Synechococcus sp. CS-1325]